MVKYVTTNLRDNIQGRELETISLSMKYKGLSRQKD